VAVKVLTKNKDPVKLHEDTNFMRNLYNMLIALAACVIFVLIYIWCMSKFTRALCFMSIGFVEIFLLACISLPIKNGNGQEMAAIFPGIIFFFMNMSICCWWSKMEVAIAVIGVAADFYVETKRIIFVSLFFFVIHLILSFAWYGAFMILISHTKKSADAMRYTILFFGWFIYAYISSVIHNIVGYTASVGVATYYFSSNAEKNGSAEIMLGLNWARTKNFGSICLGALCITILKMLPHPENRTGMSRSCLSCI